MAEWQELILGVCILLILVGVVSDWIERAETRKRIADLETRIQKIEHGSETNKRHT